MKCDKNPKKIQNMFNEISDYYDKMNNLISFGMHYVIKFLCIKTLEIKPDSMILDACCGTGDFSGIISKLYPASKVIGLDFSTNMLKLAKQKNPKNVFIQGDCTNLPFSENEFDYITMGFGLRNIEDRTKALYEIHRVLKHGGKFLHLDFGNHNKLSKIFNIIVPIIVKITGKNSEHYKYLLLSKDSFPPPNELIKEFQTRGFKTLKQQDYLFGTISMQIMYK
ncbi:MAG: ubiquinone/menaquinone biosynthesis methyltransferase [Candidatus Gastranaerophilales bacterium]|nr:ubiquinone/menaquinone biosynthesis methyltransferase [Candidatus Gastranaerophilales bacterium]